MSYCDLSLTEMQKRLVECELDPCELVEQVLERASEHTRQGLNAFITLDERGARNRAEDSRKRLKEGRARGLEGIPLAYKDMFCTDGVATTAGSKILEDFIPPYSAFVVEQLEAAGAIGIGKCNQDEFAMGSFSNSSFTGAVVNPLEVKNGEQVVKDLSAGGSSGGSAVAVAAKVVPAALGTDTGGSVRQPAAFTGIVGVKPTYGLCSRFGIIAYASSLDQAGAFARNVKDAALVLENMIGHDKRDMTSVASIPTTSIPRAARGLGSIRVGIIKPSQEYQKFFPHLEAWQQQLDNALAPLMKGNNWEVEPVAAGRAEKSDGKDKASMLLDPNSGILEAYYIIAMAEASSNLARYDGVRYTRRAAQSSLSEGSLQELMSKSRSEGFGVEVQRRILMGTHVLSSGYYEAIYLQAQKVRRLVFEAYQQTFNRYDLLLSPVSPSNVATPLQQADDYSPRQYFQDFYTVPVSLAGLPCLSLPAGLDKETGLPFAMQLIAPPFQEELLFAVANHFESAITKNGEQDR